ncbi:sulfotransferase [Oceaniferula spumae]|uniref:Sulfotransferase n=1 Tax=Oceaniferula spumae TaxID=2979115 RepID=A0AAT9FKT9_9BACT
MATSLKQLTDHNLLVAAFAAAQTNQHELAIKHFKEAVRRDPGDPFAYLEMGKCYHAIEYPDQSRACLEKVSGFAETDPSLLIPLAAAYQVARDYPRAIDAMRRAVHEPALQPVALIRQAELLELSNQLDDAEEVLDQVAEANRIPAYFSISAKLYRRRGEFDKARSILEELIAATDPTQSDFLASLQYELALIYDKLGDYSTAYKTLKDAKSHHMKSDAYKISERGRRGAVRILTGLCRKIEPETLSDWAGQQSAPTLHDRQPCFLLGHPRSGTTLIEQALDAHPDVVSADETSIFHNTAWMPVALDYGKQGESDLTNFLDSMSPNYVRKLRKNYRQHWLRAIGRKTRKNKVWLDKNPALTTRLGVIARLFPDARIIFALRDPRDVILSSFMQPVGINDWSINWLTLEETVDYYCFAMQMWLDIREKISNPWMEVRYEDVVGDFEGEARRVTSHLGLEWNPAQLDIQSHVRSKVVFSPTYSDVTQPIYQSSIKRWENYREQLAPFEEKLAPYVQQFGY